MKASGSRATAASTRLIEASSASAMPVKKRRSPDQRARPEPAAVISPPPANGRGGVVVIVSARCYVIGVCLGKKPATGSQFLAPLALCDPGCHAKLRRILQNYPANRTH